MRTEQLRTYMEEHETEMLEDLKSLIEIPSERKEAEPGKPFGAPAAAALAKGTEILKKYGFPVKNYDNYAIAADFNEKEKELDILAHLDVVPAGEGWTKTDPFTPYVEDGKIYGRGTADDKGPAIAAIYAMRAIKELGVDLKKNVRLVLGSDEECGSSDLAYYYQKEQEAPCTFSPDAEFPLINIEKGGMRGKFFRTFEENKAEEGIRLVSLQAGTKLNVVPGKAYAVVAGISKDELKTYTDAVEKETGVSFELAPQGEQIHLTAVGAFAHASTPEMGNNALTALLALLAKLPLADEKVKDAFAFLHKVYPHGDHLGAGLGVAMSDEASGELTLSLDLMDYDGKTLNGSYDCRAPICATNENLRDVANAKMKEGGFTMDGSGVFAPHHVPADSPFVQTLLNCYTDVTGKEGKPFAIGGGTYVHHLKNGVAFGCAEEGVDNHMHGADEFMELACLKRSAVIFAEAVLRVCGE